MTEEISQFIDQFEIGEERGLVIYQRGEKYGVTLKVESKSRENETVTGVIKESEYSNDSWDDLMVRIEKDQSVFQVRGNPFGPLGFVYEVK